jgi:phenylacetate-CoA ligase
LLKIQELKAAAMMVTLTYILGMTDTAKHKIGLDPATLGIQRITCTGEPGAGIPSTKKPDTGSLERQGTRPCGHN